MKITLRKFIEDLVESAGGNFEKEVRFYHPEHNDELPDYFDYHAIESKQPNHIIIYLKD